MSRSLATSDGWPANSEGDDRIRGGGRGTSVSSDPGTTSFFAHRMLAIVLEFLRQLSRVISDHARDVDSSLLTFPTRSYLVNIKDVRGSSKEISRLNALVRDASKIDLSQRSIAEIQLRTRARSRIRALQSLSEIALPNRPTTRGHPAH
jgi:uncharacterized membrane protein YhiD involved in acid resistance